MKNLTGIIILVCIFFGSCVNKPVILIPDKPTDLLNLASSEVKRYIYLVNGIAPEIKTLSDEAFKKDAIIISPLNNILVKRYNIPKSFIDSVGLLKRDGFALKTFPSGKNKILLITSNSELGLLYGAYEYAEKIGVRFYAHGDILPDSRKGFSIPVVSETASPLFETRGLQPFHDFPEGPDWWNSDDYKVIFSQMVKMKMNFFGLHTYPEGNVGPEPTVWIGIKEDINPDGTVKSAYPARYFTTTGDTPWGYNLRKTGDYFYGCGQLYESDFYGSEIMKDLTPHGPVASGHGFTPEYEWKIEPVLQISDNQWIELMNRNGSFFNDVFTFGRSLGIKMCVGTETPLIIPKKVLARIKESGKDASEFNLRKEVYEGIFKRIMLSYPVDYYWFWTPEDWTWSGNIQQQVEKTRLDLEGAIAAAEEVKAPFSFATCGWVLGPVQDRSMFDRFLPASWAMSCINREVGFTPVEPGFAKISGRPKWAIPWLEDDPGLILPQLWAGRMRRDAADALAFGCTGLIGIHWRTINLGPNISALAKAGWSQPWNPYQGEKLNAMEALERSKQAERDMDVNDFYIDWAENQFGKDVAVKAAEIFEKLDGTKTGGKITSLPRPGEWTGPGGVKPDTILWDQRKADYMFVEEFEELGKSISGDGNNDRFEYWLNTFKYLRATGKFACSAGEINRLLNEIKKDTTDIDEAVVKSFINVRVRQITEFEEVIYHLLNTISSNGELGTMTNWQQHNYARYIFIPGKEFEKLTKRELQSDCWPSDKDLNIRRLIVPTLRTTLHKGEDLNLKVIILAENVNSARIFFRPIGKKKYNCLDLVNLNRSVWNTKIPAEMITSDFEYYIEVKTPTGKSAFPPYYKNMNQTVVIY